MTGVTATSTPGRRNMTDRIRPGYVLGVALAVSVALNMWLGRGITFTTDELVWFMLSPDLGLKDAFDPYVGHLILTSKLTYKALFETIGPEYWLIRLTTALVLAGVVVVLYRLLRKYCGEWPALGISLVVLFFSGDPAHVFHGNGITVLGSVCCGVLALLLLTERTTARSVLACLALCVGVATYSQALPFLVGVTVFLLALRRLRDLWVPAVPFFLYFAWWIWASSMPSASQSSLEPERIYMLPVWGFRATGAVAESLLRLPDGLGSSAHTVIGLLVAAFMVGLLIWLLAKGRANPLFFAGAATLLVMWALVIVVPVEDRDFNSPRYMYPFLIASAITWGSLLRVEKPNRTLAWAAAALVAALCLIGIYRQEQNNDMQREGVTVVLRSGLAGVEAVGPTNPALTADYIATQEEDFFLNLPFRAMDDLERPSVSSYTKAVDAYGPVGFTEEEIREEGPKAEYLADRSATRAADLGFVFPLNNAVDAKPCRRPVYLFPGGKGIAVPPGIFEVRNPTERPGLLSVRRLSKRGVAIGEVAPRSAIALGGTGNRGNAGFRLVSRGPVMTICRTQ
ncbi:MAG: hypothetical protein KDB52_09670 [Solirubrobacterales bacterium]|nr:hypothetical protein [Solirubrobacterales bacterium]